MFFLGYHGTSETHALSIIGNGVLVDKLSPSGQIGKGFYIAKQNGALPDWAATIATTEGRDKRAKAWFSNPFWKRAILHLSGQGNLPRENDAQKTILKVYATRPLNNTKWSIMKISSLQVIKAVGGLDAEDAEINRVDWLQMVIPPDECQYLLCVRDNGVFEASDAWPSRESPF